MHFIIPPYQRGYRWESRQIEELLDDLLDFVKSMKSKKTVIMKAVNRTIVFSPLQW
uniref:GmrSD restriction endonuclease domain-containing protein n=1 Tax=Candidatus Limisoma sp. TaxID=3076476 RepID=UPI003FED4049